MNTLQTKYAALAAGIVALAAVPSAQALASLRLSIDSGATWTTIADGGAGDSSGGAGVVTFNNSLGSWVVNVTTGISKPVLGSAIAPHMDLNSVNVSSSGPSSLIMEFTDTGFGPLAMPLSMAANIGGTTSGTVAYSSFYDAGNGAFAATTPLTTNPLGLPAAFSSSTLGFLNLAGPFSLTQRVTLTHSGSGSSSFDAELKGVPEGGFTLSLLGGAIICLGFLRRRLAKA